MFVLTAAEMREVDRRTVELGIPDAVLMENAGHRVVELLAENFAPLHRQRIVVLCGKGNNGGDGIVVARQLFTRFRPASLDVVVAGEEPANMASLRACGFTAISREIEPRMRAATILIDALLGTGLTGPPREPYASLIGEINSGFPAAKVVAVDIPSGLASDFAHTPWDHVHADATVTFTASKLGQVLDSGASACGELRVAPIGSPESICVSRTRVIEPGDFAPLLAPRPRTGHKGSFGHVLVIGGAPGKTGAAAMAGLSALRAGAGLVTVASSEEALAEIGAHAPELMTDVLPEYGHFRDVAAGKTVFAAGPGMGVHRHRGDFLRRMLADNDVPTVIDADGLNNIAPADLPRGRRLILTPHPGEMSRLIEKPVAEIQADRIATARAFAVEHDVLLVLKGFRTIVAMPSGEIWINPTGGPAMATGGAGDILTGLTAGLVAQYPDRWQLAAVAAVWLHGCAGDRAAEALGEKTVIATDLLRYLPAAFDAARDTT
ncbi:MAG: NAD(P)H-hydrate dehydratase [Bryobacteraceae bacterium]